MTVRPRLIPRLFVVVAMVVMPLAAGAGPAAAQDAVPPCLELPEPATGLDPAIASVYASVTAIRDGVAELGDAISSTDDFSAGWTTSGPAAAAVESIRAGMDQLDADMEALAVIWGLNYEVGPGFDSSPPAEFVATGDLAMFTTDFPFFDTLLPELDTQSSQSAALDFWRNGGATGGPCSWAGTLVEVVQTLPPGAISPEREGLLAETGAELELFTLAALTMIAGGAMLLTARRAALRRFV